MTSKEIEMKLSIPRATIRFYEKEGLLNPNRAQNGYREYSEKDLEEIQKIILFRKIGIPIATIQQILIGDVQLSSAVQTTIYQLNEQMKELQGAISVCHEMENDAAIDNYFDLERYTNMVEIQEESGNQFFDYLKDYASLEKKAFYSMWSNVFFSDMESLFHKKGVWIGFISIFGICLLRGFIGRYVWKTGSFWYGFLYPFILFLTISVLVVPLFVLSKMYKDVEEEEKSPKRSIPGVGVWKILGGLLLFVMIIFGIPWLIEDLVYTQIVGVHTNYIITGNPYILYLMVGLYFLVEVVWLYGKHGIFGNLFRGEEGVRAHFPRKVKRKILGVTIVIYLIAIVIYTTWFTFISDNQITMRRFLWTKEYSWEDVKSYRLSAGFDGTLRYTIEMKDGEYIDLMGSVSSSHFEENQYPDGEDDYLLDITEQIHSTGATLEVDDWNRLERNLTYEYWKEYAEKIKDVSK